MDPPGDRLGGLPTCHQREELGIIRALDAVRPPHDRCDLVGQQPYAGRQRGTALPFFWHLRWIQEEESAATCGSRPLERVFCVVVHTLRYRTRKKVVTAVTWN